MKKVGRYKSNLRQVAAKIHLVDKFLILFMAILMVQSAYTLFINQPTSTDIDHIDVVIRTSMAAIFGYILSANFIRHTPKVLKENSVGKTANLTLEKSKNDPQNHIGFSTSTANVDMEIGTATLNETVDEKEYSSNRLQIIVAGSIGVFALEC